MAIRFTTRRLLVVIAVVAVLLGSAVYVSQIEWFPGDMELKPRPFDPVAWKAPTANEFENQIRGEMLGDLLKTHNFSGWTRQKVEGLLGPADNNDLPDGDFGYVCGNDWIDYRVLVFDLDANGKVRKFGVVLY